MSTRRKLVAALAGLCLVGGVATTVGATAVSAAPSGYVPHSALINGDSVTASDGITDSSGNAISLEQYAAQKAGFTVTVVDGTTWSSYTAADFAKYQVLIIGDPFCNAIPDSVISSASTFAPVVMGTSGQNSAVGNRTVVGTDPEFHYAAGGGGAQPTDPNDPSTAGAEHLVQGGIAYAGGVDGATGLYFDTTCGDSSGQEANILNSLSSSGTGFTLDTDPPCGGSVQLIASNPAFSSLTSADIQGWQCSDHTTYPTYPTDWQPLAVATDTSTQPTCGTDPNTGTTACGESYVLVSGRGIVVTAPNLSLAPQTGSDPAGGMHTVTATVTQDGAPSSGVAVTFEITGQNAGVSGTCVPASCSTDANGQVSFTYSDVNGAGSDTINASITVSGSTQHATASEDWTAGSMNHPPVANNGSVTTPQNTPVATTLSATDADNDPLTYSIVTGPAHGTLSGTAPNYTYTPTTGYTGADSFTWKANDGKADSNVATESITVTPAGCTASAPTLDKRVSADITSAKSTFTAPKLTTAGGNELILAFVEADGPSAPTQYVSSVSGGGLTWTLAKRSNTTWGTTEVWQAYATAPLANAVVSAKLRYAFDGSISVAAFKSTVNHVGAVAKAAGTSGTPKVSITPTTCGSLIWAAGHDWTNAPVPTPAAGQTFPHLFIDNRVNDSFWTQKRSAPTSSTKPVTIAVSGPTTDRWTYAAVEILPSPTA